MLRDKNLSDVYNIIEIYRELFPNYNLSEDRDGPLRIWQIPKPNIEDIIEIPWDLLIEDLDVSLDKFDIEDNFIDPFKEQQLPGRDRVPVNLEQVFEVCAWYQSHHFYYNHFGIYFRLDCIFRLAYQFWNNDIVVYNRCINDRSIKPAFLSALAYLFIHELYHFNIDMCITLLECIVSNPRIYIDYYHDFYEIHYLTHQCIEEALANRAVYGKYKFLKMEKGTLINMLDASPLGYNRYSEYKGKKFSLGDRELMHIIMEYGHKLGLPYGLNLDKLIKWPNQITYFKGYQVPLYIVKSGSPYLIQIYGAKMS